MRDNKVFCFQYLFLLCQLLFLLSYYPPFLSISHFTFLSFALFPLSFSFYSTFFNITIFLCNFLIILNIHEMLIKILMKASPQKIGKKWIPLIYLANAITYLTCKKHYYKYHKNMIFQFFIILWYLLQSFQHNRTFGITVKRNFRLLKVNISCCVCRELLTFNAYCLLY